MTARESKDVEEQRRNDAEIAANPPRIEWEPGPHGIWVARLVEEPRIKRGRRPRPPCECELYGSAKRRVGEHHDEGCLRRIPW